MMRVVPGRLPTDKCSPGISPAADLVFALVMPGIPQVSAISAIACGLVWVTGCGGSQDPSAGRSYTDQAQAAYEAAMDDFRDDDCLEAEPAFRSIRRKYAYSRFAALAELRVADCHFMEEQFSEAIGAYRQFIRNRPSHAEIPYARFRVAQSFFEQIPSDWFLSPPAHEKDQGSTRDALKQLRRFILDYPDDPRTADANRMVQEAMSLLGQHEFYVAKYYYKRDHYRAAIGRLHTLLAAYPGSGLEPEALLMLVRSFLEIDDRERAKDARDRLVTEYPDSDEARAAAREL
ncbi:MAG: outer membrane protein assembly factor BamD [Myxococcales bacterium]|nr:outer membrane protein assembly factor BamD [Myxococcales bacterium]